MVKGNGIVFKLNKPGVRELMKSQEMTSALIAAAQPYDNGTSDTYTGKSRTNVTIEADSNSGIWQYATKKPKFYKPYEGGKKR